MRLNKWIAHTGLSSRRAADNLIAAGKVRVNGQLVKGMGIQIDPSKDVVEVNNKVLGDLQKNIYIILNKPRGVVSTAKDEQGRQTVLDLVKIPQRVYPVGRLDFDSEGLILLTNDGEITYKLTHPKFHVNKVYRLKLQDRLSTEDINKFARGVRLEDGFSKPVKVSLIDTNNQQGTLLEVVLGEGRKRQIRRMCQHLGWHLLELKRICLGPINLDDLPISKWRYLTDQEVATLRNSVFGA